MNEKPNQNNSYLFVSPGYQVNKRSKGASKHWTQPYAELDCCGFGNHFSLAKGTSKAKFFVKIHKLCKSIPSLIQELPLILAMRPRRQIEGRNNLQTTCYRTKKQTNRQSTSLEVEARSQAGRFKSNSQANQFNRCGSNQVKRLSRYL